MSAPDRHSLEDLNRILRKIEGQEGQTERAEAIRAEIERREKNDA